MYGEPLSVKEYAEREHVSPQSVYEKIRHRNEELSGHVSRENGRIYLDSYAQELLKPAECNSLIARKADNLQSSLDVQSAEFAERERIYLSKCDEYAEGITARDLRIAQLESELSYKNEKITQLENALYYKNAENAEMLKRINELTDRTLEFENFKERLDLIFSAFEDSKNSGLVRKLGNYIAKG